MEKQTIRNGIAAARKENKDKHAVFSQVITQKLISSEVFTAVNSYHIYIGTEDEVQTKELIYSLLRLGKRIFAPRTEKSGIVTVEVLADTVFRRGAYGIEEPQGEPYFGEIDLVVVPLVAFDAECNRIGHGKGHYDAFLQAFDGYKVGLAFEYQKVQEVEVEVYDVPLDAVVTEKTFYARYKR